MALNGNNRQVTLGRLRLVLDVVVGIGAVLVGLWFVLDSFRR